MKSNSASEEGFSKVNPNKQKIMYQDNATPPWRYISEKKLTGIKNLFNLNIGEKLP